MPSKNDDYDFSIMLEEAQNYYNAQIRSLDVLRDHGKTVLGSSSVVVTLFAVFGTSIEMGKDISEYAIILLVIGIMYGWLMSIVYWHLSQRHSIIRLHQQRKICKCFLRTNYNDILNHDYQLLSRIEARRS